MNTSGPYQKCNVIIYDGGEQSLDRVISHQNIVHSPTIHVVKDGESIHSIANQYYKDSGKWHIIAEANHIFNPFKEIDTGIKLIIPR